MWFVRRNKKKLYECLTQQTHGFIWFNIRLYLTLLYSSIWHCYCKKKVSANNTKSHAIALSKEKYNPFQLKSRRRMKNKFFNKCTLGFLLLYMKKRDSQLYLFIYFLLFQFLHENLQFFCNRKWKSWAKRMKDAFPLMRMTLNYYTLYLSVFLTQPRPRFDISIGKKI